MLPYAIKQFNASNESTKVLRWLESTPARISFLLRAQVLKFNKKQRIPTIHVNNPDEQLYS